MSKFTVEDFVKISSNYSAVRIEIRPGKYEDLNTSTIILTDMLNIISSTMHQAINKYKPILDLSQEEDEKQISKRMLEYMIDKNIIGIIKYEEYDQITLDAYRISQKCS